MNMTFEPSQAPPLAPASLDPFDRHSGNRVERLLFNHRMVVIVFCAIVTVLLGWQASRLKLAASFEKMVPAGHPYVAEYLRHKHELNGVGNAVRIAVESTDGDIFNPRYLDTLAKINDEVFLLPGVDRAFMKSLWTTSTRWTAVTEEGLEGGTVMPGDYDGSAESIENVRRNVERSGLVGQLIGKDLKSSVLYVPLLDRDPTTGQALDYALFAQRLEGLRQRYESKDLKLHVTGFAKIVGDLVEGLGEVLWYFAVSILIVAGMVYGYNRDLRSTVLVVLASLVAVVWQLGLLPLLGFALDPYSVLVPFLVFAIGMSHGAQKMNGIMQDIGRGAHKLVAARLTFRRLFIAGLTALLADVVGFAVLFVIDIPVIRELALSASLGVGVLIFTNLILLPVLLSYTGVSPRAAARSLRDTASGDEGAGLPGLWGWCLRFTGQRAAKGAVAVALCMAVVGVGVGTKLRIGDLDPGAPELRPDSRYNRDSAFMVTSYAASADIFVVMVKMREDHCTDYRVVSAVDDLAWALEQLPGVDSTSSVVGLAKLASVGYNEGSTKWFEVVPSESALGTMRTNAPRELLPERCDLLPLYVYLQDHKADTLSRVVKEVERFKAAHETGDIRFLLAAGSAGIEAATNIVVQQAWYQMLGLVYLAVIVLCWITFKSWRAIVVAVLPLMLTSVLAEALMVGLGMGVKVATLPVIALGVGIGVDYALYILSVTLAALRDGRTLSQAYATALRFTGKVVMLTGCTLALAVVSWSLSDIKFQADMGILLAFMFLWNMVGALVLLPALCRLLLVPKAAA